MDVNCEKLISVGEQTVVLKSLSGETETVLTVLARISKSQKSGHERN